MIVAAFGSNAELTMLTQRLQVCSSFGNAPRLCSLCGSWAFAVPCPSSCLEWCATCGTWFCIYPCTICFHCPRCGCATMGMLRDGISCNTYLIANACPAPLCSEDYQDSPRTCLLGLSGSTSASTHCESQLRPYAVTDVHDWLAAHKSAERPAPLSQDMWISIERLPELENLCTDDGISRREFGRCAEDFDQLATHLNKFASRGLVLFHLARRAIIVFMAGRLTNRIHRNTASAESALSWMRAFGTIGLMMQTYTDRLEFSMVEVLKSRSQPPQALDFRKKLVSFTPSRGPACN